MIIFPAIDLYGGKAVRLYKGDYRQMTVYSENPAKIAEDFAKSGADHIHIVDLEGAKDGSTPNIETVKQIIKMIPFAEIGGGIRSMEVADTYINAGAKRVILGTAAVSNRDFLLRAIDKHGDKIAVGADIMDGFIRVKGWTENAGITAEDFFSDMQSIGVSCIICTDISKDGAMAGTNREMYKSLGERFSLKITASGGVSSIDDVIALRKMDMYGAIIGKAYYTGAINLKEAIEVAK